MLSRLKWPGSRLPALALSASLAMTVSATAQGQFAKECSLKDVTVITWIEDHGRTWDVPAERLGSALMTMLEARSVCSEGRISEALALYQSVLDIRPTAVARGERQ
jgi:hypothetical protein